MKLSDLLKALAGNENLTITLIDSDGVKLISFNASGYESVESDLQTHEAKKIQISGTKEVNIVIGDVLP